MKLLVVVDMQNDFIDGPLGTPEAKEIVPFVRDKIELYKEQEYPIIYTHDTHDEDYLQKQEGINLPVPHCMKETYGWELNKDVSFPDCAHIFKDRFGALRLKYVVDHYRRFDIDAIEVCGLCTDICVITNVLLLKTWYPEIPIMVDMRCCAGVTPEKNIAALQVMESCQVKILNKSEEW